MATFIIYIIRWAVCLTLLYSLFGLFLKRETLHGINRIVLLFVLISSMVLPFVQVSTKEANIVTQGREMIEYQIAHAQNPLSEDAERIPPENPDNGVTYHTLSISEEANAYILIAVAIYLAGLIVCWLRYFWQMAALLLMIHRSTKIKIEGVPSNVHVVTNTSVKAPCSWMRWMILNPADVNTRAIIKHELAHIRLGHSWDMLLCELTCRMLWFVPFAWMLRQDLRDVHEYQADAQVLQGGIRDEEYQLLLIKKATSTGLQPVVNAFNQSPIKRRFKMMYRKPSRRWVALKATYLLPLSALAVVAFARPQTLSEIEEKVETEVTKAVATVVQNHDEPASVEQEEPTVQPTQVETKDTVQVLSDANLVNADLNESGHDVLEVPSTKSATELLDSTMQAVGARKIAEGIYIGHFQPSLNGDTVRIARATILDRKSQQTNEHLFAQNAKDPYAYNITLNAETRKDRTGYYIRYLQPVNSTVRNYDKKEVDPKMLSTDSVLTKRSWSKIYTYTPVAIERLKKETRIYMYTGFRGEPQIDLWRQQNYNRYSDYAIVDELTGDKYVCRASDYDYFKYVKDEHITYVKDGQSREDTINIYQVCLVFPPIGKNVREAYFGPVEEDGRYSNTFDLTQIPRKGRVITK
ncbi:MAG: M56 family metallopeptidase [Prevotella sp.]|nr:M56 family metallopeptidase [Prevotella sp.]